MAGTRSARDNGTQQPCRDRSAFRGCAAGMKTRTQVLVERRLHGKRQWGCCPPAGVGIHCAIRSGLVPPVHLQITFLKRDRPNQVRIGASHA